MGVHLNRAQMLLEQGRYELAEKELRSELAYSPEDPIVHSVLAICLSEQNRFSEAIQEAEQGVGMGPDVPYTHYVRGNVFYSNKNYDKALDSVNEAIRLDPEDADYFSLLACIRFDQKKWQGALDAAEQGLAIDPEDVNSANIRAMSLAKLGREKEAETTIDSALRRDPSNAVTHANQGWTLLQRGNHKKAMVHFREALRLEPTLDWAREGIIEALKARHFIYRIMLRYFFWTSRLSDRAQWGILIGGYLGYRFLLGVAQDQPQLAPFLWPLVGAYIGFALMTWIADPVFNLLLRIHPFGKLALSKRQTMAANWVGGCIALALIFLGYFLYSGNAIALMAALSSGLFVIPVSGAFRGNTQRTRRILTAFTVVLGLFGACWLAFSFLGVSAASGLGYYFFIGILIYSFLANYLIFRE